VLRLIEQLEDPLATVDLGLRRGVELGSELRERRELAELREVALQPAGDLLSPSSAPPTPRAIPDRPTEMAGRVPDRRDRSRGRSGRR
jgi:hypothetical protein